jgi:thiosulfate reductase cytochrome b subunit
MDTGKNLTTSKKRFMPLAIIRQAYVRRPGLKYALLKNFSDTKAVWRFCSNKTSINILTSRLIYKISWIKLAISLLCYFVTVFVLFMLLLYFIIALVGGVDKRNWDTKESTFFVIK